MFNAWFAEKAPGPRRPRSAERYQATGLSCLLGDVLDLSTSGVRIRCHQSPAVTKGDTVSLAIKSESQSVRVSARVVWVRRAGLRGALVGLQFVNVRPGIAAALEQLGRYGFISTDATATGESAQGEPVGQPVQAAVEVEDLYSMLAVSPTATEDEIKRSYHRLALELHPDRSGSQDAAAKFADVAKAYKVLRSPSLRRRYDELLARCGLVPRREAA
ncbi:Chaperone protein DnaJ [Phycisphaerales bacterium]|nr:Chaperone protein DnaJ [Phycisphaerales bacterium]